jgi:hypothetical protein
VQSWQPVPADISFPFPGRIFKTTSTGMHFLHNRVGGAGFFEAVINLPDVIKAFTYLSRALDEDHVMIFVCTDP